MHYFGLHTRDSDSIKSLDCVVYCCRNPQLSSLSRPITIHQRLLRKHHAFSGPKDCLRTVYKTEGYIGLNRGMLGLIIREVPAIATYFTCYEGFQQIYRQIVVS